MFKQRPLNFFDYLFATIFLIGSVYLNYLLWTIQSGICDASNNFICATDVNFQLIQYSAYGLIALTIFYYQYLYYIHIRVKDDSIKSKTIKIQQDDDSVKEALVVLDSISIKGFSKRPKYLALAEVENGFYIEIDKYNNTSNRVVEVINNQLPEFKTNGDFYVLINAKERQLLLLAGNLCKYQLFTPGSFNTEGFYLEIDTNCKSTERYVHNTHKLPPTKAKGYRWIQVSGRDIIDPESGENKELLKQTAIVFDQITERKLFEALSQVENGYYLEISKDFKTSNRVVLVEDQILPRCINSNNVYVSIDESEKDALSLKNVDFASFIKFTPGSYKDPGYYLEVNLENISTDYYIYTERRLPPTHFKGYRWIKVEERYIKNK